MGLFPQDPAAWDLCLGLQHLFERRTRDPFLRLAMESVLEFVRQQELDRRQQQIEQQQREIEKQQRKIARLEQENERLRKELEAALRASKRAGGAAFSWTTQGSPEASWPQAGP